VGDDRIGRLVNDLLPWPVTMVSGQRTEISVIGTVGERTILNQQGTAYLSSQDVTDLLPDNAVVVFAYLNCCCVWPEDGSEDACDLGQRAAAAWVAGVGARLP
jgi:hypothetical protein